MAKEKLEKIAQPNDFKRKKSNKNKPDKSKKGVLNKKQSQKNSTILLQLTKITIHQYQPPS